ncbi:MAG: NAD(+) synthase [Oscillospiraceae bacterium]|nr:NAD(+) synthase [Oscillospiraceae bacterium]
MDIGFLRVGTASPRVTVGNPAANTASIRALIDRAPTDTALLVFPELCVTGYTCGDLFFQQALLAAAEGAVRTLLADTANSDTVLVLGAPVPVGGKLYNAALVCQRGQILGIVPKTYLPGYAQFAEGRVFAPAAERELFYAGQDVTMRADTVFACREMPAFCLGVEICEDFWAPAPPSLTLARQGTTVIANLSASDEAAGKTAYRRILTLSQSARLNAAYLYASAGEGESTGDLVFGGHKMIAEDGVMVAEQAPFGDELLITEIDVERLQHERRRLNVFDSEAPAHKVEFTLPVKPLALTREISPTPFLPAENLDARCEELLAMQAHALAGRLRFAGLGIVIGLSGGLDSALALLAAVRAYTLLGRPAKDILAVTMPGFGTTAHTKGSAWDLAGGLGVTITEIPIADAVAQHLKAIGHSGNADVTYENAQARERTQILMDMANQRGALVLGTGDLSELALGWATFGGDLLSMFNVNAGVPKTLVRALVGYEANRLGGATQKALEKILGTPVTPELLPTVQPTEQLLGPYEVHDFYLYYLLRYGCAPKKLYRMACCAFGGKYAAADLKEILLTFLRRFFTSQFKRSGAPDGVRMGSVSLALDWRMPADVSPEVWMKEAEEL